MEGEGINKSKREVDEEDHLFDRRTASCAILPIPVALISPTWSSKTCTSKACIAIV
jgi:hypothetical protein